MRRGFWSGLFGYLVYGIVFCALILVPWAVVDALIERLPFTGNLEDLVARLGVPRAVSGLLLSIPVLVFLGWLLRGPLWGKLRRLPVVGRLLLTTDRVVDALDETDGDRRDLCVWLSWPTESVRTVGIVTGRARSAEGEEALTVYVMPTSGTVRGGMLRIVSPDKVTYPGWTVDEAIEFVTTGGAVSSELFSEAPKRTAGGDA